MSNDSSDDGDGGVFGELSDGDSDVEESREVGESEGTIEVLPGIPVTSRKRKRKKKKKTTLTDKEKQKLMEREEVLYTVYVWM